MSARVRGTCSVCGGCFQLTRNGRLRHHGGDIWTAGRREYRCPGAGQPPQTCPDVPIIAPPGEN